MRCHDDLIASWLLLDNVFCLDELTTFSSGSFVGLSGGQDKAIIEETRKVLFSCLWNFWRSNYMTISRFRVISDLVHNTRCIFSLFSFVCVCFFTQYKNKTGLLSHCLFFFSFFPPIVVVLSLRVGWWVGLYLQQSW